MSQAKSVHYGLAAAKAAQRSLTLAAARAQQPERFSTTVDPKTLVLPDTAWINKPVEKLEYVDDVKLAA